MNTHFLTVGIYLTDMINGCIPGRFCRFSELKLTIYAYDARFYVTHVSPQLALIRRMEYVALLHLHLMP